MKQFFPFEPLYNLRYRARFISKHIYYVKTSPKRMSLKKIREYVNNLLKKHKIDGWTVHCLSGLIRNKYETPEINLQNCLAFTCYKYKALVFDKCRIRILTKKHLREIVLHEIAHIISPHDDHGSNWRYTFAKIGGTGLERLTYSFY